MILSRGEGGGGDGVGWDEGEDNREKGDDTGIRLANAFISIRRGRVTCSPLRSISSTSFARSPPPVPFSLHHSSLSLSLSVPLSPFVPLPLARYLPFASSLRFSFCIFFSSYPSCVISLFLSVFASPGESVSFSLRILLLCRDRRLSAILFSLR